VVTRPALPSDPRRTSHRAHRRARLLSAGGAIGGVFALLGAWLAIRGPHALVQRASGVAELLMVAGLGLALVCGVVATTHVGLGVIVKLDGDRRAVRLKDPRQ
jgi:hypothetical protein